MNTPVAGSLYAIGVSRLAERSHHKKNKEHQQWRKIKKPKYFCFGLVPRI
jgi:hypothetical protein